MSNMQGFFRPKTEPAQLLYDTFQNEAKKRPEKPVEEWILSERKAVWSAARDYAQQHGLRVLSLEEIEAAERYAMGHIDYGAKWAYRIVECWQKNPVKTP
jgi:hypothetical protein